MPSKRQSKKAYMELRDRLAVLLDALCSPAVDQSSRVCKMVADIMKMNSMDSWDWTYYCGDEVRLIRIRTSLGEYTSFENEGLKPESRFKLCCMAVEEPELKLALSRVGVSREALRSSEVRCMAQVIALFQNREQVFRELLQDETGIDATERLRMDFVRRCYFDAEWFRGRRPLMQSVLLGDMVRLFCRRGFLHPYLFRGLKEWQDGVIPGLSVSGSTLAALSVWMGRPQEAGRFLDASRQGNPTGHALATTMLHLFHSRPEAMESAALALKLLKQQSGAREVLSLGHMAGLLIDLARFVHGSEKDLALMRQHLAKMTSQDEDSDSDPTLGHPGFAALAALDHLRLGSRRRAEIDLASVMSPERDVNILSRLLHIIAWLRVKPDPKASAAGAEELRRLHRETAPFPVLQRFIADVLADIPGLDDHDRWVRDRGTPQGLLDLTRLVPNGPAWETRLAALENLARSEGGQEKQKRVCWILNIADNRVEGIEETLGVRGWGRRRTLPLTTLPRQAGGMSWLSSADREVVACIETQGARAAWLRLTRACDALCGHPLLFRKTKGDSLERVTLSRGTPELHLEEVGPDEFELTMGGVGRVEDLTDDMYFEERGDAVIAYRFGAREKQVLEILRDGLRIPRNELGRVLGLTRSHLNLPLCTSSLSAEDVAPASTPVLQIGQTPAGFEAVVGVRPFGRPDTMFFPLASGTPEPVASLPLDDAAADDPNLAGLTRTVRVKRDFADEQARLDRLCASCPILADGLENGHWTSGSVEDVLGLLEEVRESAEPCLVEWPRGQKLRLVGRLKPSEVKVSISGASGRDWFDVSGSCRIDEDRFISLAGMLANLKGSRFVALGEGEYVALTDELRRQLSRLRMACGESKKDKMRVSGIASPLIRDYLDGMEVEACDSWQANVDRMQEAYAAEPKVPSLLRAELRDYQREGYEWLQRLAIWGVGACLADDMGLGKTLQAIAVLLNEAAKGPCLVIAPTSVLGNWEMELGRFAPSLTPHRFGATGRAETVKGLQAGDVLIAGYGLLPNVEKELASRPWSMIVFDEAQALKNPQTRRTKVCRRLQGGFRLALTGTPIENRIEDLWSIFSIINPGLLGSWESFSHRFGQAAAGTSGGRALRALVRPFLLRRLKSAVLDELPGKTEQNLMVTPNEKELAFYEKLRRDTVERLTGAGEEKDRRFEILAALTRLRRACCHPGLADPDMMQLEKHSSKTELFLETVENLVAGGHKVLAFSQFTTYLAMIRDALDERGFTWQYLDGSTPEKERRARVAAFQSGKGDVFLLSLKAGGTGINLTAADYVIHLDPWWNPAVEDQASDRAHRIGQKRPVTIYRMVQEGSVEEKILDLHASKRELAADFLEGTETGVRSLTAEELLSLMR